MKTQKNSEWQKAIDEKCDFLSQRLVTEAEFTSATNDLLSRSDSPIIRIEMHFESPDPFGTVSIISASSSSLGACNGSWEYRLNDNRDTCCRIAYWTNQSTTNLDLRFNTQINNLIDAFWKPHIRTKVSGLADNKRADQIQALAGMLLADNSINSLLFCDLDDFKDYNDKHGQTGGDKILREFGATIEKAIGPRGIALHNGGDEFLAFTPGGDENTALGVAHRIHRCVENWCKSNPDYKFSVSIGISTCREKRALAFKDLVAEAESVIKSVLKPGTRDSIKPLKGTTRFHSPRTPKGMANATEALRELGKAFIKSVPFEPAPFGNAWLNLLSESVFEERNKTQDKQNFSSICDEFEGWARFQWSDHFLSMGNLCKDLDPCSTSDRISPFEFTLAVAHGLLRIIRQKSLDDVACFLSNTENAIKLLLDGVIIWQHGTPDAADIEFSFGSAPISNTLDESSGNRAVLIKIGHDNLITPSVLFSETIVVDERPTKGGGLPDFWELTLARFINHVNLNPRVTDAFILGDHRYATRTIAEFRNIKQWEKKQNEIADRTATRPEWIQYVATKFCANVHFVETEEDLWLKLAQSLHISTPIDASISQPEIATQFLHISNNNIGLLQREDGCRADTIADAYPLALDILRNTTAGDITDHAGLKLKELLDFKIIITSPQRNQIPEFFKNESDTLNRYFNAAFCDDSHLFGKAFKAENQLDVVVDHVCQILSKTGEEIATRRAVLVVPNKISNGNCAPLGLIAIRIIPRFRDDICELSYSFTWRTVEAIIGLPFSLFGSVKYAEFLTDLITKKTDNSGLRIQIGNVFYIANSLHFFVDKYSKQIIRRIVHEAAA